MISSIPRPKQPLHGLPVVDRPHVDGLRRPDAPRPATPSLDDHQGALALGRLEGHRRGSRGRVLATGRPATPSAVVMCRPRSARSARNRRKASVAGVEEGGHDHVVPCGRDWPGAEAESPRRAPTHGCRLLDVVRSDAGPGNCRVPRAASRCRDDEIARRPASERVCGAGCPARRRPRGSTRVPEKSIARSWASVNNAIVPCAAVVRSTVASWQTTSSPSAVA